MMFPFSVLCLLASALVSPISDRALQPGQVVPDIVLPQPLTLALHKRSMEAD
jgi:hypothetical protein